MKLKNPFAFSPLPVTIFTTIVYAALIVSLLIVHHVLPDPPASIPGVDLDKAWRDLQTLSNGYHPYNSRRNDEVRDWLLGNIESILHANGHTGLQAQGQRTLDSNSRKEVPQPSDPLPVVVFSDLTSNVSYAMNSALGRPGYSTYFEGTNIMVYIRGSEDDPTDWWLNGRATESRGVLVNAHYDSVSTGYGATDDGVAVVTILQLITYFSQLAHQPKKGIIALFNNGEEDYLNGARAFSQHLLSTFPKTFLNLEGAGAGGRATLFRSTDTEVTRSYSQSEHPFGSVISADAFKRGLVQSETDYSIFISLLGMRGLDVAFMEPRARYHTDQDNTKHTSKASLYHMLSTALSTMYELTADVDTINQEGDQNSRTIGSDGVWFDLFGSVFAVFQLYTLFAVSVTLLVIAPLTQITIGFFLYRTDRLYLFSGAQPISGATDDESISIKGRRGIIRWPITFVLASAAVIGLAFLVVQVNPFIIYSSPYAVWSMMFSAWIAIIWTCLSAANRLRPTALQRLYTLLWMSLSGWIILVATTIFERDPKIAGGYLMFFYFTCIFLATTVCLLEQFGLPRKSRYAGEMQDETVEATAPSSGAGEEEQALDGDDEGVEVDENTSLIRGAAEPGRTTFKHYTSPNQRAEAVQHGDSGPQPKRKIYGLEQPWSHSLISSLWFLEFVLLAPFPLIILGQVSLLLTSALSQTLADGGDPLTVYLAIATLCILLFAPLSPFLHRYTYHFPTLLSLIFIGTLVYNLVAFPFSSNNRLKLFFQQKFDLDTGLNNVTLTGISTGTFLLDVIDSLPSAAGKDISCIPSPQRKHLTACSWPGLSPNVVPSAHPTIQLELGYRDWVHFNVTCSLNSTGSAHFHIKGLNTRACKITFNRAIRYWNIRGSGPEDDRLPKVSADGSKELRLWSREWGRGWEGDVWWDSELSQGAKIGRNTTELEGQVICLWSDANTPGVIPALDEIWRFAPDWAGVTKAGDGLVEGSKAFAV